MHDRFANTCIDMQGRVAFFRDIRALDCMTKLQIHPLQWKALPCNVSTPAWPIICNHSKKINLMKRGLDMIDNINREQNQN